MCEQDSGEARRFLFIAWTAIEFSLCWTGTEHQPFEVKVWNGSQRVEVMTEQEKIGNVWYWNVYAPDGEELISFINFWEE